jgi:hypothetical protein
MRKLIVLGVSAVVLALGVAEASAIQSTEQWQEHLDRMSGGATSTSSGLRDFRAQASDRGYVADPNSPASVIGPSVEHRGR